MAETTLGAVPGWVGVHAVPDAEPSTAGSGLLLALVDVLDGLDHVNVVVNVNVTAPVEQSSGEQAQPKGAGDARKEQGAPGRDDALGHVRLSPRQREILSLAAQGLTNTQIAEHLFLSVSTVERHCTIAYRGLGVRNRAGALAVMNAQPGTPLMSTSTQG